MDQAENANINGLFGLRGREGEQSRVEWIQYKISLFLAYTTLLPSTPPPSSLHPNRPLMIGLAKDACPLGTVLIRRATKEDLVASKLLLNNFQPQAASFNNSYVSSSLFIFNLKQHLLINVLFHKNARIYTKLRCSYIVRIQLAKMII